MLMLRLQRLGKIKQPSYRLIVSDKHHDTQYGSVEILGTYNPLLKEKDKQTVFKTDRIKYWLSVGAQPSATVNNLLVSLGLLTGKKQKSVFLSKKRSAAIADKKAKDAPAPVVAAPASASVEATADKPAEAPAPAETPAV
jgi:small subunit ribosomal protein S16